MWKTALAVCSALAVTACGGDQSGPGTLVGDAYIVLETGQEVSLANMPIRLIPQPDDAEEAAFQIDSPLAKICPRRTREQAEAETLDTAAHAAAWGQRNRILSARVARTVASDAAAHFVIDSVPSGSYRLWADTTYGGTRWTWLQPVRVAPGDTARVVLSNANPDENPFRCQR